MILAIDPGLATLGYALVDQNGAVHELGVLLSESNAKKLGKQADREARLKAQVRDLDSITRRWKPYLTGIVAEELSFNVKRHTQTVCLCLSWGGIVGLARKYDVEIRSIPPKTWQGAIAPTAIKGKAIDYEVVSDLLAKYVGEQCRTQLVAIKATAQNHALDAVGVGVYAAMTPDVSRETKQRRRA